MLPISSEPNLQDPVLRLQEGPDLPTPLEEGWSGGTWVLIPYLGSKKAVSWGCLLRAGSWDRAWGFRGPGTDLPALHAPTWPPSVRLGSASPFPPSLGTLGKSLHFSRGRPAPSQSSNLRLLGCFSSKLEGAKLCTAGIYGQGWFLQRKKDQRAARLAQSVEHETLNLRVVGSSPTLGVCFVKLR